MKLQEENPKLFIGATKGDLDDPFDITTQSNIGLDNLNGSGTLIMSLLVGCGHEHTWTEATCTEPKTCSECGETDGEPLGHTWVEATCAEPKHCSECGETEGEALEHTWTEATYQQAKTCSVCETTEGEPLQSDFEKYGIPCNVVLDQEFDYVNSCYKDETQDTIMKGLFTDYKCFVSDDLHEAKEGYVWQTVTMRVTINDYNGWHYGANAPMWWFESYYNMTEFSDSVEELDKADDWYVYKLSQNYNGQDYNECLFKCKYRGWEFSEYWDSDYWDEAFPGSATQEIYLEALVPENSEGLTIVLWNPRVTGEYVDYFFNLNNLDSVETFRLPVANPNQ